MIGIILYLMKALHFVIVFKKGIAKIRKRATFRKQSLDKKLFLKCHSSKSIFFANNARMYITRVYLLFMLPVWLTTYHMCSVSLFLTLPWIDVGNLLHLRWNTNIYIYTHIHLYMKGNVTLNKRWNWSSWTKLALSASWTHGLIAHSVRASERNSVVVGSSPTQANFL